MIDPHVHLRDGKQAYKETIQHGLSVAYRAGLDAVFEMPNTDPPLISEQSLVERIRLADACGIPVFHGIYAGLTSDLSQVDNVVNAYNRLFPRVVGLKLYAGSSTGSLAVTGEEEQWQVLTCLVKAGFKGVLAVHCEKEALFCPEAWDAREPSTHCLCRPPESETESVRDLLRLAGTAGFRGCLHICHVSVPESVYAIEAARPQAGFKITCGITPHHALLDSGDAACRPFLKINPPLRIPELQEVMLALLKAGRIDWIETDHAPHALVDKPAASGIPGLAFYPHFVRELEALGLAPGLLRDLTHNNPCAAFGIAIQAGGKEPEYRLEDEYPFDPYKGIL